MVKTKRGEKERRELAEENRRLDLEIAALEQGNVYIPSPKKKKTKRGDNVKSKLTSDDRGQMNEVEKGGDFEKWWAFYMGYNKLKQDLSKDELKHVKKMNVILQSSEWETVRDLRHGDKRISLWFEMDSTPYSSRVQGVLQRWTIDRGSSILNFSIGVMIPITESCDDGTSKYSKIPLIAPSFLLPKKKADSQAEAEKLYAASIQVLVDMIVATAPDMSELCGSPLLISISADWAASNRLAMCYVLSHLDEKLFDKNFIITLQRCIVHSMNNSAGYGCTRLIKNRTNQSVKDVARAVWKRAALMCHNAIQCDLYISKTQKKDFVVREERMVGVSDGCRVGESRRFMDLLNDPEETKTRKRLSDGGVNQLSFFEEKIVWVVDGRETGASGDGPPEADGDGVESDDMDVDGEIGNGLGNQNGFASLEGNDSQMEGNQNGFAILEDREPTDEELAQIQTAMRKIGISVVTGSSNRWTMQARSCRSLLRASVSGQIQGMFRNDKDYHVGGGEFVNICETFGEGENLMIDLLCLGMSYVSRPADRAILSLLKTRESEIEDISLRLGYLGAYQHEHERCIESLSRLKEAYMLLLELGSEEDDDKARLTKADKWVFAIMMALLACRAQIQFTSGEECLERLERVERDAKLSKSLDEGSRRKLLTESINRNLTQATAMSSRPETLAAKMIQDIQFECGDGESDETICQNIETFLKSAGTGRVESSLVERVHGWFVKVAQVLKISDVSGCGARTMAQTTAKNFQKIEKSELKVRKAEENLNKVKLETNPTSSSSLIQCGLQMFKGVKAGMGELIDVTSKKFKDQNWMSEWLMLPKAAKEEMGKTYQQIRSAEWQASHEMRERAAKKKVDEAAQDKEARIMRKFWNMVKSRARTKWTQSDEGVQKYRDQWNKMCQYEIPKQSGAIMNMWKEEAGLLVSVSARIAYATGNQEKRAEHIEMVHGLDPKKVPQKGFAILSTNVNSANPDAPRSPALDFSYVVVYASTQPLVVGLCALVEKEIPEGTSKTKLWSLDYYQDPIILTGHGWLGAKFRVDRMGCHVRQATDEFEFFSTAEIFVLADAEAAKEAKRKPKWEKEKKQYIPKAPKEEIQRHMKMKVNVARANDRKNSDFKFWF